MNEAEGVAEKDWAGAVNWQTRTLLLRQAQCLRKEKEVGGCWESYYVRRRKDQDQERWECEVVVVGMAVVFVRRWEYQL